MPTLIGFGMKRSVIIISKVIINLFMMILMFIGAFIAFYLIFYVIGLKIDSTTMTDVLAKVLDYFLRLFVYISVASLVVYGTQKATMSMVAFALLITMFVDQMLLIFLNDTLSEIFVVIVLIGNLISNLTIM
ncbi:MAG: hypothetical protein LBC61_05650 [Candidatus Peribacteria bacterium]|nr:hypothetical protein [Candidatus Peribacteria bacterium]